MQGGVGEGGVCGCGGVSSDGESGRAEERSDDGERGDPSDRRERAYPERSEDPSSEARVPAPQARIPERSETISAAGKEIRAKREYLPRRAKRENQRRRRRAPSEARIPASSSEARIPAPQARIHRARRRARENTCLVERQREYQRRRRGAPSDRREREYLPRRAKREYQRRRQETPSEARLPAPQARIHRARRRARENTCLVERQRAYQRRRQGFRAKRDYQRRRQGSIESAVGRARIPVSSSASERTSAAGKKPRAKREYQRRRRGAPSDRREREYLPRRAKREYQRRRQETPSEARIPALRARKPERSENHSAAGKELRGRRRTAEAFPRAEGPSDDGDHPRLVERQPRIHVASRPSACLERCRLRSRARISRVGNHELKFPASHTTSRKSLSFHPTI